MLKPTGGMSNDLEHEIMIARDRTAFDDLFVRINDMQKISNTIFAVLFSAI